MSVYWWRWPHNYIGWFGWSLYLAVAVVGHQRMHGILLSFNNCAAAAPSIWYLFGKRFLFWHVKSFFLYFWSDVNVVAGAVCCSGAARPAVHPIHCAALLGARVSERMCMLWLAHMPYMDVCDSNGSADVDDIRIYEHPARRLNKKIQQIYTIYLVSSIALWWAITRMLDTDLCVVCWGRRSRNWSDKNRKKKHWQPRRTWHPFMLIRYKIACRRCVC